jgi:hypothetical protein
MNITAMLCLATLRAASWTCSRSPDRGRLNTPGHSPVLASAYRLGRGLTRLGCMPAMNAYAVYGAPPIRCTLIRCTPERDARRRYTPIRCPPIRDAHLSVVPPMHTQKAGLSLVASPLKISHTGRHCVGWHAVVCYGAPEWFR